MASKTKKTGFLALVTLLLLAGLVACAGGTPEADVTTETAVVVTAEPTIAPAAEADTTEAAAEDDNTASDAEATVEAIVAVENGKLNLNEATGDDYLNAIPGFSNRMVREFLEYRPYVSIQQFRREIGKYVSDEQVAEYEQYVYVPVDVDEADAATLMQLPGVDEAIAESLIAARPFNSNDAFLTALATYVSSDDVGIAAGYLTAE